MLHRGLTSHRELALHTYHGRKKRESGGEGEREKGGKKRIGDWRLALLRTEREREGERERESERKSVCARAREREREREKRKKGIQV